MINTRTAVAYVSPDSFFAHRNEAIASRLRFTALTVICDEALSPETYMVSPELWHMLGWREIAGMMPKLATSLVGPIVMFPRSVFDVYFGCEGE